MKCYIYTNPVIILVFKSSLGFFTFLIVINVVKWTITRGTLIAQLLATAH